VKRLTNRLWAYVAASDRCPSSDASDWYRRDTERGVDALL